MPDRRLFRSPDEMSGPAVMDREPILLPEARKEAVGAVKDALDQ